MPRLALTLLALLAFLTQSYVTQTHIHLPALQTAAASGISGKAAAARAGNSQQRDHFPSKDDPDNCPLCQQIAVAGTFVSPAVAVLALPAEDGSIPRPGKAAAIAVQRFSHGWQGRAPPVA